MFVQTQEVYDKALELPPIERIELIKLLYFSLDSPHLRKYFDQLWAKEIEARISAFERGELKLISSQEVFAKIERYQHNGN